MLEGTNQRRKVLVNMKPLDLEYKEWDITPNAWQKRAKNFPYVFEIHKNLKEEAMKHCQKP